MYKILILLIILILLFVVTSSSYRVDHEKKSPEPLGFSLME